MSFVQEIILSKFKENISWLNDEKFNGYKKKIYLKDKEEHVSDIETQFPNTTCVKIPNVGREGHTYLYHIVENYENLADVTFFLPGSCMDNLKRMRTLSLFNVVENTHNTIIPGTWIEPDVATSLYSFVLLEHTGTNLNNKNFLPENNCEPSAIRPFGKWYQHFFGDLKINVVCYNSIFAISKIQILQHPKEYYQSLLSCVDKHSNPEAGHFLERSWVAIFHEIPQNCLIATIPRKQQEKAQQQATTKKENELTQFLHVLQNYDNLKK